MCIRMRLVSVIAGVALTMAERLAGGNSAIALLANTAATVAVLATLIALLAPVSQAHFNPAVSLVQAARGSLSWGDAGAYALVQVLGCCLGAILAHDARTSNTLANDNVRAILEDHDGNLWIGTESGLDMS